MHVYAVDLEYRDDRLGWQRTEVTVLAEDGAEALDAIVGRFGENMRPLGFLRYADRPRVLLAVDA